MKNIILYTVIVIALLLPTSLDASVIRIGSIEEITCNNIFKRDSGPVIYDYCRSLKNKGLAHLNHNYQKTLTNNNYFVPILGLFPVRFYTEDGLLFAGGYVNWFFKPGKINFTSGDFVVKFDVDVPDIIDVSNPNLPGDEEYDEVISVPEPSSLIIFGFSLIILISLTYNRYK
jgi:hypothetical protein